MGEVSLLLYLMIARHSSNFYTCTVLYILNYYKQLHNWFYPNTHHLAITFQYLQIFLSAYAVNFKSGICIINFMMFLSKKIVASFSSINVLKALQSYKKSPAQKHFHSFVRD